jgi:hypothetical protein
MSLSAHLFFDTIVKLNQGKMKTLLWIQRVVAWAMTILCTAFSCMLMAYSNFEPLFPSWMQEWSGEKTAVIWILSLIMIGLSLVWVIHSSIWYDEYERRDHQAFTSIRFNLDKHRFYRNGYFEKEK